MKESIKIKRVDAVHLTFSQTNDPMLYVSVVLDITPEAARHKGLTGVDYSHGRVETMFSLKAENIRDLLNKHARQVGFDLNATLDILWEDAFFKVIQENTTLEVDTDVGFFIKVTYNA